MNYIGLDISFTGTGLVVIDTSFEILKEELISSNSEESIECRIIDINDRIFSKIEKYKDSKICIEGLSFSSRGQSTLDLAGLHFYIRTTLFRDNYIFYIIPPTTLKKFVTGTGRCQKNLMLLKCYKKFGIEFDNDNLCDAYCLARYGLENYMGK